MGNKSSETRVRQGSPVSNRANQVEVAQPTPKLTPVGESLEHALNSLSSCEEQIGYAENRVGAGRGPSDTSPINSGTVLDKSNALVVRLSALYMRLVNLTDVL